MNFSVGGLDPVLRLYQKHNISIPPDRNLHPVFSIGGILRQDGPFLDYAVNMPTSYASLNFQHDHAPTIVVVGCGGTGSHLVPNLLQYIKSKATPRVMPKIVLIDGDNVEEKNLIRQRFTAQDLGENKAVALARRYSAVFGMKIDAIDNFISSGIQLENIITRVRKSRHSPTIIIGAVDNNRARAVIWDYYSTRNNEYVFWVDGGNEAWHGQVILGVKSTPILGHTSWNNASIGEAVTPIDLPHFFDIYPEEYLAIGGTPPTPQNECARVVEEDPQTIQANSYSAQCAANLTIQILEGTIRTTALSFDAKTGNIKASILTKLTIANAIEQMKASRIKIDSFLTDLARIGGSSEGDKYIGLDCRLRNYDHAEAHSILG